MKDLAKLHIATWYKSQYETPWCLLKFLMLIWERKLRRTSTEANLRSECTALSLPLALVLHTLLICSSILFPLHIVFWAMSTETSVGPGMKWLGLGLELGIRKKKNENGWDRDWVSWCCMIVPGVFIYCTSAGFWMVIFDIQCGESFLLRIWRKWS
jgi:hypothetical protein